MKLNLFAGGGGGRGGESLNDEADYAERARTNSLNNRAAYARSISQPVLSEVESLDEKDRYSRVPIKSGLVTNSIFFCLLFTIKDWCKKVRFQQMYNQAVVDGVLRPPRLASQT